jgi:ParB family chromosome partitioning protein
MSSRPKGGIGRGLGALGLGTGAGVRPTEQSQTNQEPEDVTESVPVDHELVNSNGVNGAAPEPRREVTLRDGRKSGLTQVPISSIAPNPYQPRKFIDREVLEELAASIREHGLIQPPVVSYNPDFDENADDTDTITDEGKPRERKARYLLIAGERRWQAAKLAGLTSIPVVIKETTPLQMLELALVENIQRADLNPLEEAEAYQQLVSEFGLTQEAVARKVGKSRVAVTNSLRLLALPPQVRTEINEGRITEGHGRAILMLERLPDDKRLRAQLRLLNDILTRDLTGKPMSVREAEETARRILSLNSIALIDAELQNLPAVEETPKPTHVADHETRYIEERLREALTYKVEVSRNSKGAGKIVIQFADNEQLNAIYKHIVRDEI